MRLVGYVRCSTARQASEGYSLPAQERVLRKWVEANGHELVLVHADVMSGAKTASLHGRAGAIRLIETGFAEGLLVVRYDRATRSLRDGVDLLEQARAKGWAILTTDGKDSRDRSQQLVTNVELSVAEAERERISERTREGLAAARAKAADEGREWKPGRPLLISGDVEQRIGDLHETGRSARGIATRLNDLDIPSPAGGKWSHTTITRTLKRLEMENYS